MRVFGDWVVLSDFCTQWTELLATLPAFYSLSNEKNRSFLGCSESPLWGDYGVVRHPVHSSNDMQVRYWSIIF